MQNTYFPSKNVISLSVCNHNQANAIIETVVVPKIQLIAEQHSDMIEKLSVTEEIDSLKGRISTLKNVVKTHTTQISELKKSTIIKIRTSGLQGGVRHPVLCI